MLIYVNMLNLDNLLIHKYIERIKGIPFFENLENFHILIIFSGFLFLIIFVIFYFFLFKKTNNSMDIGNNKNKPTLNDIVNDTGKNTKLDNNNNENDFIDVLVAIEEEMAAIRELYVGGYITKGIYISETDRLYEKAKVFGL